MKLFALAFAAALFLAVSPALWAGGNGKTLSGGDYLVKTHRNIAYVNGENADGSRHKLDIYAPRGKKDFPVLFFVHGGAWTIGSKDFHGGIGRRFAQNGVGAVLINYRLTPAVKHPGHIEDVAKAFAWTVRNIKKYGGRADRIFVSGHSAGAHLVSLLALNERFLKAEKLSTDSIRGVVPISGIFVIPHNKVFEGIFGDAKMCHDASPFNYVRKDSPPFFIVYAQKDMPTFDLQAKILCTSLKKSRNTADYFECRGRDHVTIIFAMTRQEAPITQEILSFIAKHSELELK